MAGIRDGRTDGDVTAAFSRRATVITGQSLAIATVCLVVDVGNFVLSGNTRGWGFLVSLLLLILADLALALPQRWVREVAIAHAVLAALTPILLPDPQGAGELNNAGLVVAAFFVGSWLSRSTWIVLGVLLLGYASNQTFGVRDTENWTAGVLMVLVTCLLPWMVGRFVMARRTYVDQLERRAERQRRDEEAAVERALAAERGALARDLHDVISHHVSTIGMHAGAARLGLVDRDPAVRRSLSAVEKASRSAMVDLRRLLDVLHADDGRVQTDRQPGLDDVDELLEGIRSAGLSVRLSTSGQRRELADSVNVAAYRVIQEALTNAVRYGDGGAAVALEYHSEGVKVVVTNGLPDRPAPREERARRGLDGLRTRVGMFGGSVSYGPEADGRSWRFEAEFPAADPGEVGAE